MNIQFRLFPIAKNGRFILLLVPLLLGAACDPLAPGATGKLVASPGASFGISISMISALRDPVI